MKGFLIVVGLIALIFALWAWSRWYLAREWDRYILKHTHERNPPL